MATRFRAFQSAVVHTVKVGENAVLILEHRSAVPFGYEGLHLLRVFCHSFHVTTSAQKNAAKEKR